MLEDKKCYGEGKRYKVAWWNQAVVWGGVATAEEQRTETD